MAKTVTFPIKELILYFFPSNKHVGGIAKGRSCGCRLDTGRSRTSWKMRFLKMFSKNNCLIIVDMGIRELTKEENA